MADFLPPAKKFKSSFSEPPRVADRTRYKEDGKLLGTGTYGRVVAELSRDRKQFYACKYLKVSPELRPEEVYEVSILRRLDALGVPEERRVWTSIIGDPSTGDFDFGETKFYGCKFSMALANCDLLQYLCSPRFVVTPRILYHVMHQLASAVAFIERQGLRHGDLKPNNVMVYGMGTEGRLQLRLGDFGSAYPAKEDGKEQIEHGCTYSYAAPEVVLGAPRVEKNNVDSWSLGCIFGLLLYGEHFLILRKWIPDKLLDHCLLRISLSSAIVGKGQDLVGTTTGEKELWRVTHKDFEEATGTTCHESTWTIITNFANDPKGKYRDIWEYTSETKSHRQELGFLFPGKQPAPWLHKLMLGCFELDPCKRFTAKMIEQVIADEARSFIEKAM